MKDNKGGAQGGYRTGIFKNHIPTAGICRKYRVRGQRVHVHSGSLRPIRVDAPGGGCGHSASSAARNGERLREKRPICRGDLRTGAVLFHYALHPLCEKTHGAAHSGSGTLPRQRPTLSGCAADGEP